MEKTTQDLFYHQLPVQQIPVSQLLRQPSLMTDVPLSWYVIITDIRRSTQAVKDGKHEKVNFVATGSIVTVLNISLRLGINIPFLFGGDGATFLIPDSLLNLIMESLTGYKQQMIRRFGIYLRTAATPLAEVYGSGHKIKIAKCRNTKNFVVPVIIGSGLSLAEKTIKGRPDETEHTAVNSRQPDLNGMQCR